MKLARTTAPLVRKLVENPGFEPDPRCVQSIAAPQAHSPLFLVRPRGIEPRSSDFQSGAFT